MAGHAGEAQVSERFGYQSWLLTWKILQTLLASIRLHSTVLQRFHDWIAKPRHFVASVRVLVARHSRHKHATESGCLTWAEEPWSFWTVHHWKFSTPKFDLHIPAPTWLWQLTGSPARQEIWEKERIVATSGKLIYIHLYLYLLLANVQNVYINFIQFPPFRKFNSCRSFPISLALQYITFISPTFEPRLFRKRSPSRASFAMRPELRLNPLGFPLRIPCCLRRTPSTPSDQSGFTIQGLTCLIITFNGTSHRSKYWYLITKN